MKNKYRKMSLFFLAIISVIFNIGIAHSQKNHNISLYLDIDFQQDYLKFSRIDTPAKIFVEQCNPMKSGIQFNLKDFSFQRKNRRPQKTHFSCKPISNDNLNSCIEFLIASKLENNLGQSIMDASYATFVMPPIWLLAIRDLNHKAILSSVNDMLLANLDSQVLEWVIGISKVDSQKLRMNVIGNNGELIVSKTIESYSNPGKIDWKYANENKFVSIFKNLLLSSHEDESGNSYTPILSCLNK
jgi:hypothetical protein